MRNLGPLLNLSDLIHGCTSNQEETPTFRNRGFRMLLWLDLDLSVEWSGAFVRACARVWHAWLPRLCCWPAEDRLRCALHNLLSHFGGILLLVWVMGDQRSVRQCCVSCTPTAAGGITMRHYIVGAILFTSVQLATCAARHEQTHVFWMLHLCQVRR